MAGFGTRACRECGAQVKLTVRRDIERKFYCSRICRSRYTCRLRDHSVMWAAANTPEANRKKGRPGEQHPNWLPPGSRRLSSHGYVRVKDGSGRWHYEHRAVTGAPPELVVHHRDGNPLNNDPGNLQLMTNVEHARHHGRERHVPL